MKRENRYIVLKLSDVESMSATRKEQLLDLADHVGALRAEKGKPPLQSLVVESDWPEYEPTWAALSARVDGQPEGATKFQLPQLDEELKWILGRPCFAVARMAWRLQELGLYTCRGKAENEQAAAIHWMVNLYLQHGDSWREEAERLLKAAPVTEAAAG